MSANLTLNAKNHARQALLETDVSNNLDLMAKAIEALEAIASDVRVDRSEPPFFAGADKSTDESREKPPRLWGRDQADGRRQ